MSRRRRGRFSPKINRFSAVEFQKALDLFAAETGIKPEDFKPPGLPGYTAMLQRSARYPEFAEAFAAVRQARIAALCVGGIRPRSTSHPEEKFAEALKRLIYWDGHLIDFRPEGMPGYSGMQARSLRDRTFRRRFLKAKDARYERLCRIGKINRPSAEVFERLLSLVAAGSSLNSVMNQEGMPGQSALRGYRENNPDFSQRLEAAFEVSKGKRIRPTTPRRKARVYETGVLKGKLLQDELFAMADSCFPKGYPAREDVMADLIEAVLAGEFELGEMPLYASEFKTNHNLRVGTFATSSLDQTVGDDTDVTYLDRLTTDDFCYAD